MYTHHMKHSAGFDYKGEPVPNNWPDVNSHFGFLDISGFLKERGYWQGHVHHFMVTALWVSISMDSQIARLFAAISAFGSETQIRQKFTCFRTGIGILRSKSSRKTTHQSISNLALASARPDQGLPLLTSLSSRLAMLVERWTCY